ncbi:type IIL restriction-modification enzyme MmeI [Corynebacterium urogenitale]
MRHNLDKFKLHWHERLDSWTEANQGAIEKKYAQSFWADFLACFGVSAARMDLFEQDTRRASTGNTGYIDLFWPSVVIGEAKNPGWTSRSPSIRPATICRAGPSPPPSNPVTSSPTTLRPSVSFAALRHHLLPGEVTSHVDELKFLADYGESMTREEEQAASIKASKIMANLFTAVAGDDVDEDVADATPMLW